MWWCKLHKQSLSLNCFSAFTLSKEWQHLHTLKDVLLTNYYLENCKMYQFINIKSKIFSLWICIQYFSFCSLIVEYEIFVFLSCCLFAFYPLCVIIIYANSLQNMARMYFGTEWGLEHFWTINTEAWERSGKEKSNESRRQTDIYNYTHKYIFCPTSGLKRIFNSPWFSAEGNPDSASTVPQCG